MSSNSKISSNAKIGNNVLIGEYTIIHDNAIIGNNTTIESHCIIGLQTKTANGQPLIIGENSHIRSHCIFYGGSSFGAGLITGHSVIVREGIYVGKNLQIGTHSEIQGDCTLGNYIRTHSEVHISKKSNIGDFVWLHPKVQFTNDPLPPSDVVEGITIKDMAVISTCSLLFPGITIGIGSFVGAGSLVRKDVPDVCCVNGNPAEVFARLEQLVNLKHKLYYPWPNHNRASYPKESYELMDNILDKIQNLIKRKKRID